MRAEAMQSGYWEAGAQEMQEGALCQRSSSGGQTTTSGGAQGLQRADRSGSGLAAAFMGIMSWAHDCKGEGGERGDAATLGQGSDGSDEDGAPAESTRPWHISAPRLCGEAPESPFGKERRTHGSCDALSLLRAESGIETVSPRASEDGECAVACPPAQKRKAFPDAPSPRRVPTTFAVSA